MPKPVKKSENKVTKATKDVKKGSNDVSQSAPSVTPKKIMVMGKVRKLSLPPQWDHAAATTIKYVMVDTKNVDKVWLPVTAIEQIHRFAPEVYTVDANKKPLKGEFKASSLYLDWEPVDEETLKILIQLIITFLKGGTASRVSPLIWHQGSGHHRVPV